MSNQKLKLLAAQAGAGWDDKYHWYVGNESMRRFAELIVCECAAIAETAEPYQSNDLILKHFGIKK